MRRFACVALGLVVIGCGSGGGGGGGGGSTTRRLGPDQSGQYHLGPVEWSGSFHNACSPYPASIQAIEGQLLAGVANELGGDGRLCDACVEITTATGRTLVARVVTYGVANAAGDLDLSSAAFNQLSTGGYPRAMSWHLVTCPGEHPVYLQFQTGAHVDWTSFWVRNPRVALARVEVKSARHASWFALRRETDGTWNDDGGFGAGAFTLRLTGVDDSTLEQTFPGFRPGEVLTGTANFP
jgi:expansin (peptidoglycan-binding protein)